jgi:hypothetical protein
MLVSMLVGNEIECVCMHNCIFPGVSLQNHCPRERVYFFARAGRGLFYAIVAI